MKIHLRQIFNFVAILCLVVLFSGCASTFDRDATMARLGVSRISRDAALDAAPKSKPPFKLAVYWDMETIDTSGNLHKKYDWANTDELIMRPFLNQLKKKLIISDYFFLPRNVIAPNDMDGIFKQAEKDEADAVICMRAITFVDWYFNPSAIFDLTIIGSFWFAGSNRDALVLLRCDFWDVKTRKLDFTIWAEGTKRTVGPTLVISSQAAFDKAKAKCLYDLMKSLNQQIHPSFDIKLLK